uniref:Uncharacterized protein n=1 Tax=Neospora caninum (strain Liverpool) TaxID=572307 RepID=A0A0F7UI74_NEOCL|nr:TPA: hypothetical protein BN1204_040385 [Neospora caninum Liverpool]
METEARGTGWRVVDEIRLMNGLRDDLASAMQSRTAYCLRLKTSFEAHQSTLTLVDEEMASIDSQVLGSSEALRQANFLLEKLSVSAVHLQKTSGIFESQLSKTHEKLEQGQKRVYELRQQLDNYKDAIGLVQQAYVLCLSGCASTEALFYGLVCRKATKAAIVEIQAIKAAKQALESELEACKKQTNELEQEKEKLEPELQRQRASLGWSACSLEFPVHIVKP